LRLADGVVATGNHLRTKLGVRPENAVEADEVEVGRGHQSAEPGDEVQRIQHYRLRPVGPNAFHVVAYAAILEDVQAVLSQRGPGDVLAKPLEPFTVATVEASGRVYADPVDPGYQVVFASAFARVLASTGTAGGGSGLVEQAQARSSGALAEQVSPPGRGMVAAEQNRLLSGEVSRFEQLIARFALLEQPSVRPQHLSDSRGGAGGHAQDIFMAERRQRVELELLAVRILHIYTIKRERMGVYV